jgi:hypothetical protein
MVPKVQPWCSLKRFIGCRRIAEVMKSNENSEVDVRSMIFWGKIFEGVAVDHSLICGCLAKWSRARISIGAFWGDGI